MFSDLNFKAIRQPLCRSLIIGVVGFCTVSNLQHACGQQPVVQQPIVQQPVIQQQTIPQNQIYQSPIYRGPVYQAPSYYPNQGRVIQPQPAPTGPVYQAPTGGVPPVAQRIPQPSQPTPQQILDTEQAAYNAEKLALVEKLLEKYKATAAENEGAMTELGSLRNENAKLVKQMGEFDQTARDYQTQIRGLEEKLSAVREPAPAAMQEDEQLKAKYEAVVKQVGDLEQEVKTLTFEQNSRLQQIANIESVNMKLKGDLEAAQKQAANSMPAENNQAERDELAEKFRKLSKDKQALEQTNQELQGSNTTLNGQYQDLIDQKDLVTTKNQELRVRIAELTATPDDTHVNAGNVSDVDSLTSKPETNQTQTFDVSPYETKISQLTRKNQQLSEINADFKDENRSLSRQLASLKNQSGQVAVDDGAATIATALPAAMPAVAASAATDSGGWGVLAWLIPFLAIGLGIAFFVIIKEELHRSPAVSDKSKRRD